MAVAQPQPKSRSARFESDRLFFGQVGFDASPEGCRGSVFRQPMRKMHDLEQIVAHGAARLTVGQMALDVSLLAQLKRPVYVIGKKFLTLRTNHNHHPNPLSLRTRARLKKCSLCARARSRLTTW